MLYISNHTWLVYLFKVSLQRNQRSGSNKHCFSFFTYFFWKSREGKGYDDIAERLEDFRRKKWDNQSFRIGNEFC